MRKFVIASVLLLQTIALSAQSIYEKDFLSFWNNFKNNYAYFDTQPIDWQKVKEIYQPQAAKITNQTDFIRFLERVTYELHNGHVFLYTNLPSSNRIIPSGQDIYVQRMAPNQFKIVDVKPDSRAEKAGLQPGFIVTKFNQKAIEPQLKQFLPKSAQKLTPEMYAYATNMLFAGVHNQPRSITIKQGTGEKTYFPDQGQLLSYKKLKGNVGYIKVKNALGNYDLIPAFDQALEALFDTKSLILDLTNTPGGGNTTVARALMGRFTSKEMPYQKHEYPTNVTRGVRRSWWELVSPRKKIYTKKLIVAVGRWTGSMGEGIAIGFDGMKRATIVGTPMAKLIGEVHSYKLPQTGIGYQIPDLKLKHIDGTPRENYQPKVLTKNHQETMQKAKALAGVKK
ncbi:MAG TPA: peptidase [Microscillaceae bacterium]|nr:peptidase [Microscillaceae bacterium]